eukprot:Gb_11004 [translate_table: standard]
MFGCHATQIESLHKDPVDVTKLITNGFIGQLREWWNTVLPACQNEICQGGIIALASASMLEFIGDLDKVKELNYQLFLSTKLRRLEDIDNHWILMSTYYYNSGMINQSIMKDIFITSFPSVLARLARDQISNVDHISLRNIFDQIKAIGKSECDRRKLQKEITNSKLYNSKVCNQLGVIGISTPKTHVCHYTKKSDKHANSSKSQPWHSFRKHKSYPKRHRRFLRKLKTPKCYICQGSHYANKCPQKSSLKPQQRVKYHILSHDIKKHSLSYVSDTSSQEGDIELFTSSDEESPKLNVIYMEPDDCLDSSVDSSVAKFNCFPKDLWKLADIILSFGNGQTHQCRWITSVPITLQAEKAISWIQMKYYSISKLQNKTPSHAKRTFFKHNQLSMKEKIIPRTLLSKNPILPSREYMLQRINSHGQTGKPVLKRISDLPEHCYDSGGILFSSKALMALFIKDSFIKNIILSYKIYLFSDCPYYPNNQARTNLEKYNDPIWERLLTASYQQTSSAFKRLTKTGQHTGEKNATKENNITEDNNSQASALSLFSYDSNGKPISSIPNSPSHSQTLQALIGFSTADEWFKFESEEEWFKYKSKFPNG